MDNYDFGWGIAFVVIMFIVGSLCFKYITDRAGTLLGIMMYAFAIALSVILGIYHNS